MQVFVAVFALLEEREDALLEDVSGMFVPCLQEHTIDWFQGGAHNLRIF